MSISTLTSKGQTSIPKDVRERVGLKPGDRMQFTALSSGAFIVRVKNRSVRDAQGLLKTRRRLRTAALSR